MKKIIKKLLFAVIIVIVVGTTFIGFVIYSSLGPGVTKSDTAKILVHDAKFGIRATQKAIRHGDGILPLIKKESNNYEKLNGRNSFWIAEVLGQIQTEQSRAILMDLHSHSNTLHCLVGALGLASHGVYTEPINEQSFLVQVILNDSEQAESHLAIIALGKTKDKNALPFLLDILRKRKIGYWYHAYSCEAIARIGSKEAAPILQECLKDNNFHALPYAFRALITLGDKQAVPLAIDRVTPEIKNYNSGFIVEELKRVTGRKFGYKREAWQKWWDSVKDKWKIPHKFLKPYDEQKKRY
jgi:hypothetical protein